MVLYSGYDEPTLAVPGGMLSASPVIAELSRQLLYEMGERTMQSLETGKCCFLFGCCS